MKARLLLTALFAGCLTIRAMAVEETEAKTNMKEAIRARLAEDAKKQPAKPAPSSPAAAAKTESETSAKPAADAPVPANAPKPTAANAAKTALEPATVLPKMEVRKSRITELDRQIQKQEHDIAREKAATKPTEADKALNDARVTKPLAFLGGESSEFRAHVANERVSLMEAERDLMEAIAQAKTKAEKQELQKQLDELKAMRRELDKALR